MRRICPRVPATAPTATTSRPPTPPNWRWCADASALVKRLNLLLCAGQLSTATQTLIVNALNATP
jgi:hypothetical protein